MTSRVLHAIFTPDQAAYITDLFPRDVCGKLRELGPHDANVLANIMSLRYHGKEGIIDADHIRSLHHHAQVNGLEAYDFIAPGDQTERYSGSQSPSQLVLNAAS